VWLLSLSRSLYICPVALIYIDTQGLELNAARLRVRKLNKKLSMVVDLEDIDYDLGIIVPDHVRDKFTVVSRYLIM
jgi:hypothetical protein